MRTCKAVKYLKFCSQFIKLKIVNFPVMTNDAILQIFGTAVKSVAIQEDDHADETGENHEQRDVAGAADGAGSQDLFSSQDSSSQRSLLNEQMDLTLDLTEFVWVQCDMPDCQKWRRIPATKASAIQDEAWYCSMNSDINANTCNAPEEDYTRYDKMAKQAGIKFVMSMLGVGSLVWAKIAGYCRWPAIVTRDPMTGVHVHLDIDGDPHSYHVEYLGKPHSHSWVTAKFVDIYGHKQDDVKGKVLSSSASLYSKSGRRKAKRPIRHSDYQPKQRNCYRNAHIEDVRKEADYLLSLDTDDRLTYVVFQYDPALTAIEEIFPEMPEPTKRRKQAQPRRCSTSNMPLNINTLTNAMKYTEMKPDFAKSTLVKPTQCHKTFVDAAGDSVLKVKKEQVPVDNSLAANNETETSQPPPADPAPSDTQSTGFDSPNQFSQSKLNISSSLVGKTKEEKFKIDVDMYRKNEKAFEHDVRRFMRRNNQKIRSAPLWHNVPISLFQLFLAVHERGGYKKACEGKQWTRIYKELTEMHHITTASAAKKYYERNLYPYELYISGENYLHVIVKKAPRAKASKMPTKAAATKGSATNTDDGGYEESYMEDINAILGELDGDLDEGDDEFCLEDDKENALNTRDRRKQNDAGINIKFHDESTDNTPSRVASCEFEFDVPSTLSDKPQAKLVSDPADDDINLDAVETKVLHEMKALEDQMRDLNDELDCLL